MTPGSNAWVRKIPWRKEWIPTPVFLPGEFHGQKSLADYSPRDCKESDTTEQLTHLLFFPIPQEKIWTDSIYHSWSFLQLLGVLQLFSSRAMSMRQRLYNCTPLDTPSEKPFIVNALLSNLRKCFPHSCHSIIFNNKYLLRTYYVSDT